MRRDLIVYLEDIRIAASDVIRFAEGLTEADYLKSELVRLAVERQLITAGEAMSQLAKQFPADAEKLPEWRQIISFRNILVHGYRAIDHRIVYSIASKEVPSLIEVINLMIAQHGKDH
jgi:uncharacterized protein with HEPN domain